MPRTLTICIVEDGDGLCRQLSTKLSSQGHRLHCASSRQLIMAQLAAQSPDLILLAVTAQLGSELDLYHRLSRHRQLRNVPVIVISIYPDLEYELLDAFDFLPLPLNEKRLQASIDRLLQRRSARSFPEAQFFDPGQLDPFREFILEHAGLHFSSRNQRLLERGLTRRMQALYLDSPQRYLEYLGASDNFDELNKLLSLLTVGETCFFRYRSHREALLHYVVPQLLEANRGERRLRVWSAGCSTGEEPFSLAILLLENFPQLAEWNVQILATDINKQSLRKAREGVFGGRALRLMEESLRQRYFEQVDKHYVIAPQVRRMVRFNYLNLQLDNYPSPESATEALDLLFCRNVLIYFQLETMRRIVASFARCLKADGYLFLGHSETLQNVSDRFRRKQQQGAFFYQLKAAPAPIELSPMLAHPPAEPAAVAESPPQPTRSPAPVEHKPRPAQPVRPPVVAAAPDLERLYREAMTALDHEKNSAAEQNFDAILREDPGHARALVGKGLICANRGDYADARRFCARAISRDDLLPEAYLLRGFILDMEEALERALVEYQKVLWLDPAFVMAHYLAAKAYARLGQPDKHLRSLRNTLRCLERAPDRAAIPFSGGLSRTVFLEIVHHDLAASGTLL